MWIFFFWIRRVISCENRTCWMMRQLMQLRCCCRNMSTATYRHSACGRTKSGIGINIGGQALYTSLIPLIKLATLTMIVSQMLISKMWCLFSFFTFWSYNIITGQWIHSVILYGEKGTVTINMEWRICVWLVQSRTLPLSSIITERELRIADVRIKIVNFLYCQ